MVIENFSVFKKNFITEGRILEFFTNPDSTWKSLAWTSKQKKNFRWAPLQPLIACQNSRPELPSLRSTIKKFFYCPNTFSPSCFLNISSTDRVQRLKFSTFWFWKFFLHQVGHPSFIIYWCSPCTLCIFYFHIYFSHWYSIILSMFIFLSRGQAVKFCLWFERPAVDRPRSWPPFWNRERDRSITYVLVECQVVQAGAWEHVCDLEYFLVTQNFAICQMHRNCANCHSI